MYWLFKKLLFFCNYDITSEIHIENDQTLIEMNNEIKQLQKELLLYKTEYYNNIKDIHLRLSILEEIHIENENENKQNNFSWNILNPINYIPFKK